MDQYGMIQRSFSPPLSKSPGLGQRKSPEAARGVALNPMHYFLQQKRARQLSPTALRAHSPELIREFKDLVRERSPKPGKPPRSPVSSPRGSIRAVASPEPTLIFDKTSLFEYKIGEKLGQGAYTTVREALNRLSGEKVALKTYVKARLGSKRKLILQEIQALEKLKHPNVIKLIDKVQTPDEYHLVLEYINGPSLHGYLKRRANRKLTETEARGIFTQVLESVKYCHSKHVTHRDIKLENIIVNEHEQVKLIDFGFSTCFSPDKKMKLFCGTPSYMAPEIVLKKEYKGPPVDIWALGVLLYVLLTGHFPFRGPTEHELHRKIVRCQYIIPDFISNSAKRFIHKMIRIEPDKRISAEDALKDPWFTSEERGRDGGCSYSRLKGCSVGGDPVDMNILFSIVRFS